MRRRLNISTGLFRRRRGSPADARASCHLQIGNFIGEEELCKEMRNFFIVACPLSIVHC
jgi:hypothetical protein